MIIKQRKDGLVLTNRFYTAGLSRRGGRVVSLARAGVGRELVYYPGDLPSNYTGGIAKECECGFPSEMMRNIFRQEVLDDDGKTVQVRYVYHGQPGAFIRWSMTSTKTFTFRADSPLITVDQTIRNIGEPELLSDLRIHNELRPSAGSVMLAPTTRGLRELPAAEPGGAFIYDFTEGLVGIWHRDTQDALLFLPEYDGIAQLLVSTAKEDATAEWFYRGFTIGNGDEWTASYRILPTPLASLAELPARLAAVGMKVDLARRDQRPQAPVAVRPGANTQDTAETLRHFQETASRHTAYEAAFTTAHYETNVALPDGTQCSRAIHTQPGAGLEVVLPEQGEIAVSAEVARRESGPGKNEACLGCCDPDGKLHAVTSMATLDFWKPSATLRLPLNELAGKRVRLFLFGRDVYWTSVSLHAGDSKQKLVSSLRAHTHGADEPATMDTSDRLPKGAIRFYVSPKGRDSFSGRLPKPNARGSDGPFATIGRAQAAVRKLKKRGCLPAPVVIMVRAGTYELDKPLTFTPEYSGSVDCPVLYAAWPGETVVISGGRRVIGPWEAIGDGVFACRLPARKKGAGMFRQLFADGRRVPRARIPKEGFFHFGAFTDDTRKRIAFAPADLRGRKGLDHAEIFAHYVWNETRYAIAGVDNEKNVITLATSVSPARTPDLYYVENAPAGLNTPNSWCLDPEKAILYWHPAAGINPQTAEVFVPMLRELAQFRGKAKTPVRHVTLQGLTFAHSDWFELDSGGQAASRIGSALSLEHAESCCLRNNRVLNVGTYGIGLYKGCRRNLLAGNEIALAGAGGIRIGLTEKDTTTGANAAIGNDIHDCGQVYPSSIGVWIGQSSDNLVRGNHIHHLPYTGISVGWTWGPGENTHKNNHVEGNTVEHVMQLMHDGGAIYLLGISYGTTVKDNIIIHADGGNGLYLDEGSTGMHFSGNVIAHCAAGFGLHGTRDNLFERNIVASMKEQMVGLSNCQSYMGDNRFRQNIFYCTGDVPLILASGWTRRFVIESGENLYFHAGGKPFVIKDVPGIKTLADWVAAGYETGPILADPRFVDPEHNDYRLRPDSPAAALGFSVLPAPAVKV